MANEIPRIVPTVYNQYKKTDFVPTADNLNPMREISQEFIQNLEVFQKQLYEKYKERVQKYFENPVAEETRVAAAIELGLPFADRTKITIRPKIYESGGAKPDLAMIEEIAKKLGVNANALITNQTLKIPVIDIIKSLPPEIDPILMISDIITGRFPEGSLNTIKNLPSDLNTLDILKKVVTLPEGTLAELLKIGGGPDETFKAMLGKLLQQEIDPAAYAQIKDIITSKDFPGPLIYIFKLPVSNPEDIVITLQAISELPAGSSIDDLLLYLPPSVDLETLLQQILVSVDGMQILPSSGPFPLTISVQPLSETEILAAQLTSLIDSLIGGDTPLTIDDLPYDICNDRTSPETNPSTGNDWLDTLISGDLQGLADSVLPKASSIESDIRCIMIELEFLKIILLLLQFLRAILQIEKIFSIIYPIIDLIIKVVEAIFNPTKRVRLVLDLAGQVFAILISWFFDYVTSLLNNLGINCAMTDTVSTMNSIMGTIKSVKDTGAEFKAFADFQTAQQKKMEEATKRINDALSGTDKEKVDWEKLWAQSKSKAEQEINVRTQKVIKNYFLGDFEAY